MHAVSAVNKNSIVRHVLLGTPASTLLIGIEALEVQAFLFSRIERLADDEVAELVRFGYRAAAEAVAACHALADEYDDIGAFDCLSRVVSGHRIAKNLLLAIVELADVDVAKQAQLGVTLAMSVLDDLGA
ncbi:hypothetical protein P3T18_005399 [Paraburkholderia sp. GAS199]|uniref:hypothetical protein n=1 Tax=Paraburkholderia sp. GAS199 TaxID=3035126 RepID=UPI003D253FAB